MTVGRRRRVEAGRRLRVAAGALLVAAVTAGCSVGAEREATTIAADDVPFALLDPAAPAIAPVEDGRTATVCLLRDDRVVPVEREVERDADLQDLLASLAITSDTEAAEGFQSAITAAEEIDQVVVQGGIASVDLAQGPDQTLAPDPIATVAQVVCTLTRQPGVDGVQFAVNGEPIDVPRDDGSLTDDPVTSADYATLLDTGPGD